MSIDCVTLDPASPESLLAAVRFGSEILRCGKVLVYPTDTTYALGVRADTEAAVRQLWRVKGWASPRPVSVCVASHTDIEDLAVLDDWTRHVLRRLLPGAFTFVLRARVPYSTAVGQGQTGTVGVRMPSSRLCAELSATVGVPITATSANATGGPESYTLRDALGQVGASLPSGSGAIDGGDLPPLGASTVVDLHAGRATVLRVGAGAVADFERALESATSACVEAQEQSRRDT